MAIFLRLCRGIDAIRNSGSSTSPIAVPKAREAKIEVAHGHSQPQQLMDTSSAWVALRRDPIRNRYVPFRLLAHRWGLPSIDL